VFVSDLVPEVDFGVLLPGSSLRSRKLGWDSVGPLPDSSLLFNWSSVSTEVST
jgi:hypothetical protein